MKKLAIVMSVIILLSNAAPVLAINIGTYKTDTEYGLFDGLKVNWKKKDKSQPFIEPREESTKAERQKERNEIRENEYQYTKYMYDGKAVL